ncbi:prepilin-type N-terminal cleavage/methylation domain-containing protein [Photobacterium kishitanii]|uniref:prepilin-type N-terminal cleavage/methylation domain-containing protein n=1 Tax=Photobacterium kishitanii TaxID=318456 RepID=UPI001F3F3BBD|nr:prepilin-type N-terminal cleavage/methylation domain-containing protein [Photobacterium kishitanii]
MSIRPKGFSFIELVIVIVVIGLLMAVALPRFINIIQQAKQAAIETISGNFSTAVISARVQWEADGHPQTPNDNNTVNYDGSIFRLTSATTNSSVLIGYPFALLTSMTTDVEQLTAQDCVDLIENLLQIPPPATALIANVTMGKYIFFVTVERQHAHQQCRYYQLASASNHRSGAINVTAGHSFTYIPAQGRVEVNLHQRKD